MIIQTTNEPTNSKKLIYGLILGLVLVALINAFVLTPWFSSEGTILSTNWNVTSATSSTVADIPSLDIVKTKDTIHWSNTFVVENIENQGLVIPFPYCTAFQVFINDVYVGGVGHMEKSTSTIWNSMFVYPLHNLNENTNKIDIHLYGLYNIGFRVSPYITNYSSGVTTVQSQTNISMNLMLILSGINIGFSLLLIFIYIKKLQRNNTILYCFVSGLLTYFIATDTIYNLSSTSLSWHLLTQKIRFAILFVIVTLMLLIYYEARAKKIKHFKKTVWILTGISFTPLFISSSFYEWYRLNIFSYLFVGILIILSIYLVLSAKKYSVIHIAMITVFTAGIIEGSLSDILSINIPTTLQLSIMTISLMISVTYTNQLNRIFYQNKYLEVVSLRDSLTNLYNRRILDQIQPSHGDLVVVLDIDNFKQVNDVFGHEEGDDLLRSFAKHCENIIGDKDMIIRLGGDEFCFIFLGRDTSYAYSKLNELHKSLSGFIRKYNINISYGVSVYSGSLDQSLSIADKRMYEMKRSKKKSI